MKAIMYGAGNIGRGFIGALFAQSGYDVLFIDVAKPVVEALHLRGSYPVRVLDGEGYTDETILRVDAIDGTDTEAVATAIATADVMATAVGANILKFIAPNIAAGLKLRYKNGGKPLNIIICENLMDANQVLEGLIRLNLNEEEQSWFAQNVGLVEASIGRMVPVQTEAMKDGDALRVCVERYGYLPVDRDAFCGEVPLIRNMVPFSPFDFYIRRKLYLHNLGHATAAYLGLYAGNALIANAIDEPEILFLAQGAMLESAEALSRKYGVALAEILRNMQDLLARFANRSLGDTCARVGADPVRKLAAADRLIGPARLCAEEGILPAYVCVGAAGAVYAYLMQSGSDQTQANATAALLALSGVGEGEPLQTLILGYYRSFADGESLGVIRRAAQRHKAASVGGAV